MAAELAQPGVEIIQEFRAVSPTILTPALVPCVVGVGKQVVDLLVSTGSGDSVLNTDAVVTMPGFFVAKAAVGATPVYAGLDGLSLVLAINNGPDVTVLFSDPTAVGLTPAAVVDQINTQFGTAGVTAAMAEVVGDGTTQWQLRTVGVGRFQFIDIRSTTDAAVATAFGIGLGRRYAGVDAYNQYATLVPQGAFPDPRNNLGELAIEASTIKAFIGLGAGGYRESLRDQAFLRNGEIHDIAATPEGGVDLVAAFPALVPAPGTADIVLKIDGGTAQSFDFGATPPTSWAELQTAMAGLVGATLSLGTGTPNGLIITTLTEGGMGSVEIVSGASVVALGLAVGSVAGASIAVVDDGDGDAYSSWVEFAGSVPENFSTSPSAAVVNGTVDLALLAYPAALAGKTLILSGGDQEQTITFSATIASAAAVISEINAVVAPAAGGKITASLDLVGPPTNRLVLTHASTGTDSAIHIVGGTAVTPLGLTAGTTRGNASKPEPGDELWIDGALVGTISEVAPGGNTDTLKIGVLQPISADIGRAWYIIAKNLPGTATRPTPDLVVDTNGDVLLKQEQLRDIKGDPVVNTGLIYISYEAVRKDVTALAESPGLLRFDDTTALEEALSPINTDNPLALGLYFALLNAPGVQVTGLGVDAISADAPYGTIEAFARAAEYLEGYEVYAIAPMTHDESVHQVFSTHVSAMSAPAMKGERVAVVNPEVPTSRLDTLVASGTDGSTVGSSGLQFDTVVSNLTALVQAAGISPLGTIPISAGLFLDIASDTKRYSIASIAGSVVTIRTTFAPGTNDDGFYATTKLNDPPLPSALVDEAFSVKVRGAALVTASGPDKEGIAETVAAASRVYGNRRLWRTFPDQCAATIEGLEQIIPGFYMTAGIAGMVGQLAPQQSFTNFPMTGYTRVIGSNDTYNVRQLNKMAGGGTWIIVQDAQGAPLSARMALTTDMTSIETRTDSITKVVDYTAKMLRTALRSFIGRFNITQGFLDALSSVIDGVGGMLVETGVLLGFHLNNIIQDEDNPDTVLVDCTLDPPYPCNYIRLTLVI
jgi:hypothetical protein